MNICKNVVTKGRVILMTPVQQTTVHTPCTYNLK